MNEDITTHVLKNAILLEMQGKSFYQTVSDRTESETVKNIFSVLADEEQKHVEILGNEFSHFKKSGTFKEETLNESPASFATEVLTEKIKKEINAASFEAAAISAAIEMENKSVALYSDRADKSSEAEEKKLYEWLARWEKTHVAFLTALSNEMAEEIWYENSFWPF